ncbi:MAG: glutamate-5-semialdehyde dehydrogenase [Verrucomicrobiae bacterium]|nr:glutamate-5-semialdehyde dehydrogenase [Verrucomicrobiae bacterium]
MAALARDAKTASRELARLDTGERNRALAAMADALDAGAAALVEENRKDLAVGRDLGLTAAMMDRLTLTPDRIRAMAQGVRDVAALPDPVGRVLDERVRPNGLRLRKVSVPLGVVVIIYESRPNVTADAASLCFKTGNATILRGGREALHSNQWIARAMVEAGGRTLGDRFPAHAIQVVPTPDREAIPALLSLPQYVDLCMPRGGEGLIRAVTECSRVPVIKHYKGVCHVYVDREADLGMAEQIVFNAKCQRPSACNAVETLLVDRAVAPLFLPAVSSRLATKHVAFHADETSAPLVTLGVDGRPSAVSAVTEADYEREYNDYVLNVRVVDGVGDAIEHINRYGSAHSDAIVTASATTAERFLNEVDSATVYWNASTRFTDGGEYGMGAEIGISTDKVGARGPMGLEELCSYKWIGVGTGQIRN